MEHAQEDAAVPVVGIGASAGGLDAISRLLGAMPTDTGCAFVVIVHLDPNRESAFAPLLSRHTAMPVVEMADGMDAQANRVHVIVPNGAPTIGAGKLHLRQQDGSQADRAHPIDAFFASMAEDLQERAIGIVLSGTGMNGTQGLRAIKQRGGLMLVQDPETAEFDGMPKSAIAAGLADLVLPPDQMAEPLLRHIRHHYVAARQHAPPEAEPDQSTALERILVLVRKQSGHDFATYKRNMLLRRIHRRMSLMGEPSLDGYAARLRRDPAEIKALVRDLMISVTSFFRDPEAWTTLDEIVLAPLIAGREAGAEVRLWVPACASGEEAYSLAMLMIERAEIANKPIRLLVFATDPQDGNLAVARQGVYPAAAAEVMPRHRLERFFHVLEDAYQVKKDLREQIVFARHDLLGNPPFSRLDLISCRNLLIYLDQSAQNRILSLFHFALRPGGALFLGNAETVSQTDSLYTPLSKKWRIFRRLDVAPTERDPVALPRLADLGRRDGSDGLSPLSPPPVEARAAELARHALLERYAPASVLADAQGRILYFHGATAAYLLQPGGEPTRDLMLLVRSTLRAELRRAMAAALASNKSVTFHGSVRESESIRRTMVTVTPLTAPALTATLLLVSFQPVAETEQVDTAPPPRAEDNPALVRALEEELDSTRSELQRLIDQLQDANETLKAANEEVISMNEELQSANEELETSKEELNSYTEELQTINNELTMRIMEKDSLADKMENLLVSTDIATIFLNSDMRIDWFSPACKELLDLLPGDVGRPIETFAWKFSDTAFIGDVTVALRTLARIETEIRSNAGRWYLRRIHPHRTRDDRVVGSVVTFTDITERKHAADAVDAARVYAETIVDTIRQPLLVLDSELRIRSANRAFCAMFSVTASEVEKVSLYELQSRTWDIPQVRSLLDDVGRTGTQIDDVFLEQDFAIVGHRAVLLSARKLPGYNERGGLILLAIEDVTGRVREAQFQHDAAHDELTGLPNRREFLRRLRRAVSKAKQQQSEHALCYLDLDQFKLINDTAGHAAGDALLQQIRPLLAGLFRDRDTLGRMGGDEFAILLDDCQLADATRIAETVLATLRAWRFDWEGRSFQVGASAGVVAITRHTESVAQVLSQADVACYAAKEAGRNRVMAYEGHSARPSARHAEIIVAATLKHALEQGRFRLFAQPIVSLKHPEQGPAQYEVLARMVGQDGELSLPSAFIPAAERFGLMPAIDRWVIDSALRMFAASDRTADLGMLSVNIAGASLDGDDLLAFVLDRLQTHGVPPARICFEITETAAIRNLDHTASFIAAMKARGSQCAMDDFGSGMAPFRFLRRLPVDFLKIDGTFVAQMVEDPQDEAMVAAINEMAHALGIATIAEYAHDDAVVERLRRLGVDYAQGYAFGAPVSLETLL